MNENTFIRIIDLSKDGIDYKIGVTQKNADKRTRISCKDNAVIWCQTYPLGISPVSEENVICQPSAFIEKGRISVLVISGKPDLIEGLDEGAFLSAGSWDRRASDKLYVMSENAFSQLGLQ